MFTWPQNITVALCVTLRIFIIFSFSLRLNTAWVVKVCLQAAHLRWSCALLLGSSAAQQRFRWLRFDLDKRETGVVNLCAWSPSGVLFSSSTHSSSVPSQFIDLLPAKESCSLFYFHTDTWKADEGWCITSQKHLWFFFSFLSMLKRVR